MKSQDELDRAEVTLVMSEMVHEVVEVQENLELRAAVKALQEDVDKTPYSSREGSRRGSFDESEGKGSTPFYLTAMLMTAADDADDDGGVEDETAGFKSRVVEEVRACKRDEALLIPPPFLTPKHLPQLGKRSKLVRIQRTCKAWLSERDRASRRITRWLRRNGVEMMKKSILRR